MGILCLTGVSSHYFLIRAYDMLDAVVIQPLTYLQLVFSAIIGVTIFGENLSAPMILGALIVGVFRNGLQLMGVASIYQTLITGVLVILAVTVDQISRKKAR